MSKRLKNISLTFLVLLFAFSVAIYLFGAKVADAASATVSLEPGAYCRVDENSGLRFKAKIEKTAYDELKTSYGEENISAGMIIVPTSYVTAAGGYTFNALSATGKTIGYKETTDLKDVGDYYSYSLTISNLKDGNYTRSFSAIAYVKSAVPIDGFIEYDGNYYDYAAYDSDDNARTVYMVAKSFIQSGDTDIEEDEFAVIKGFADSVADVTCADGQVTVNNDVENYESPYSVAQIGNDYVITYPTGENAVIPKSLIVNGNRSSQLTYSDGDTRIILPLNQGATFGADGSVTIRGTELKGAGNIGQVADVNNGYVAYSGNYSEYGVGTYIDFEFTGNNMPQVMFFADVINGNMTGYSSFAEGKKTGVRGILSCNGFIPDAGNSSNLNNGGYNTFKIWGANRIYLEDVSGTPIKTGAYAAATANYNYTAKTDDYRIFTQVGLNEMPDTTFRYTVGTCEVNGEVYYEARLTYTDGIEEKTVYIYENTGVSVAELKDAGYGNIVIYGTVKGADKETTFKIVKTPYIGRAALNLPSQGAMMNADGSVTLTGKQINSGAGYASTISDLDNSYIAWEGNYGVGNYITFNFTGNNMPQVTFFANNVNGNMTDFTYTGASANAVKSGTRGNNGILLSNGFYCGNSNGGTNRFAIFGPNRYNPTAINNAYVYCLSDNYYAETNVAFAQTKLTDGTKYKYVAGTRLKDGTVYIDAALYDGETGEPIESILVNTNLTQSEAEALGTNIIAYATVKGTGVNTTFTFTEPIIKN